MSYHSSNCVILSFCVLSVAFFGCNQAEAQVNQFVEEPLHGSSDVRDDLARTQTPAASKSFVRNQEDKDRSSFGYKKEEIRRQLTSVQEGLDQLKGGSRRSRLVPSSRSKVAEKIIPPESPHEKEFESGSFVSEKKRIANELREMQDALDEMNHNGGRLGPEEKAANESGAFLIPTAKIKFSYGNQIDGLPSLGPLSEVTLPLGPNSSSSLRELIDGVGEPVPLSFKDLHLVGQVVLQYFESLDCEGIVVFPDPLQVDPVSRKDLRDQDDTSLRLIIWLSVLKDFSVEHKGAKEGDPRIPKSRETAERLMKKAGLSGRTLRAELFRFGRRYDKPPFQRSTTRLHPSGEPGEVNAVLEIEDKKRFGGVVSVANSGTESLGDWNFGGGLEWYRLATGSDSISANWSVSDTLDRQAYGLTYRTDFLRPGVLSGGLRLFHSKYDASSFAITAIDFEGATDSAEAFLDYRPLEWETENSSVQLYGSIKTERVTAANSISSLKADARFLVPALGIRFSKRGSLYQSLSTLSLKANLRSVPESDLIALGGIDVASNSRRLTFDEKLRVDMGQWYSKLSSSQVSDLVKKHFMLFQFHASLGLGNARNLPQHQFVLGGTGSVRGYPEYPAAGDNGYRFCTEYYLPLCELPAFSGQGTGELNLVPFLDFGETFVEDPKFWESDKTLFGAGLGIQFSFPGGGILRIDFAKPLREIKNNGHVLKGTGSSDGRIHASLNWPF